MDMEDFDMKNAALFTAGAIFALVSLAHWVRFLQASPVLIGDFQVPVVWSLVGGLITLALAIWMVIAARN